MTHVKDLMTKDPVTCRLQDCLNRAAQLMWEHDCGCVPVVDDSSRILGIVTDRDICMGAYTQGQALSSIAVSSVCTRQVFTCSPDDTIERAEAIMSTHSVRRLPVIERDGRLVGILSIGDLASSAHHAAAGKGDGSRKRALSSVMQAVSRLRTATHAKTKREHPSEASRRPAS